MKIVQIVAFHESAKINPTIVALAENGQLYVIPLTAVYMGVGEWTLVPPIPEALQ